MSQFEVLKEKFQRRHGAVDDPGNIETITLTPKKPDKKPDGDPDDIDETTAPG